MFQGLFITSVIGVAAATTAGLGAPVATVIAGESQALISWAVPGQPINGINIEESVDSGNNWISVTKLPPTSTHLRVQSLTDGKNYWFRVRWIWPDNSLGIPSATLVAIPINNPSVPSGLVATASDTQVALSWDQVTTKSVIGYDIEQSTNGGSAWTVINSNTGSSSSGFLINDLTPGTTYSYRIKALAFGGGQSEYSEAAVVKIGTSTPGGFLLNYTIVASKITLTWDAPQDLADVAKYEVNASGDGGVNWFTVATTAGGVTTAIVPYVIGGSAYQVIATSATGMTSISAIEIVQTNAIPNPTVSSASTPSTGGGGGTVTDGSQNSSGNTSPQANPTPPTINGKSSSPPIVPIAGGAAAIGIGAWFIIGFRNRNNKGKSRKRTKPKRKRKSTKKSAKKSLATNARKVNEDA